MIAAIVPAAGASRRMGRPKLLLPVGGTVVVARVVEALRSGGVNRIVLVIAPGDLELASWAGASEVELAVNPDPSRGMLSTVVAGLGQLGEAVPEVLLVAPGDLPWLTSAEVRRLLVAQNERDAGLAVPVFRGRRGHPLAIARRLIAEVLNLDPEVGLRQLLALHPAELCEVESDSPGVLADLDTPEDYQRLLSEG